VGKSLDRASDCIIDLTVPAIGLLRDRRVVNFLDAQPSEQQTSDHGFSLIELLIVIVVLGILSAVVVFSLGGVATNSRQADCKADGTSMNTAVNAYKAANGSGPTTSTQLVTAYLASWPSTSNGYTFSLTSAGTLAIAIGTAGAGAWAGSSSCSTVS
jgi:general secretion pathway protein G